MSALSSQPPQIAKSKLPRLPTSSSQERRAKPTGENIALYEQVKAMKPGDWFYHILTEKQQAKLDETNTAPSIAQGYVRYMRAISTVRNNINSLLYTWGSKARAKLDTANPPRIFIFMMKEKA
jgi:hypothetical protein